MLKRVLKSLSLLKVHYYLLLVMPAANTTLVPLQYPQKYKDIPEEHSVPGLSEPPHGTALPSRFD